MDPNVFFDKGHWENQNHENWGLIENSSSMHKYDKQFADGSYLLYPREMLQCDICFHNFISIVENLDYHKYYDLKNKRRYYHSVQKTFGQWREI